MNLIHFCNFSTRTCDYNFFLIMTGNAHKESSHKLLLKLVREKGLYIIKTDTNSRPTIRLSSEQLPNVYVFSVHKIFS